jgi:hypothetical protein
MFHYRSYHTNDSNLYFREKTKQNKMTKAENTFVSIVNVPKEMTNYDIESEFIEIKAELLGWVEERPVFILRINDLPVLMAQNIKWIEFNPILEELVSNHFKQFLK